MQRLLHFAQYVAPLIGVVGVVMFVVGLNGEPKNWTLVQQGLPLLIIGLVLRPRPGHPMAKLLGMHSGRVSRSAARSKAKRAKRFLRETISQNADVLDHEPGELRHHASPVKLVPRLPGEAAGGRSWIGGEPMLPEGMVWPETNGAPMLFLAQLALDELPSDIWGGLGPREGWLVFFMPTASRIDEDTRVLHVADPVAELPWPEVTNTFYFGRRVRKARETLIALGLPAPSHPPRFPVAVQRDDEPAQIKPPYSSEGSPRDAVQRDYDPRSPEFRPFDSPTARVLVAELLTGQREGLENVDRKGKAFADAAINAGELAKVQSYLARAAEEREARIAAVASLERLAADLAAQPDASFAPEDADAFLAKLESIEFQRRERNDADEFVMVTRSVLDEKMLRDKSLAPFEILVQATLRNDPARVPDAVRTRFEALWRYDQSREYAVSGGSVHDGFPYARARDPVFLLELPSSNLVGWVFGDVSRLGVFIDPRDLAAGRWRKAWGDILN